MSSAIGSSVKVTICATFIYTNVSNNIGIYFDKDPPIIFCTYWSTQKLYEAYSAGKLESWKALYDITKSGFSHYMTDLFFSFFCPTRTA